jgi:hypothetical protein
MVVNVIRGWNVMSTYRKIIIGVFGMGLVVFGFWTLSPLFYNRHVDEAFPAAVPASQAMEKATAVPAKAGQAVPTAVMADAATMTDKAVPTAVMADAAAMADKAVPTAVMADAAAMADKAVPTAVMADKVVPAAPVALTAGMFIAGSTPGHNVDGKATIYRLEDGKPLLRLEDFSATNGPDLFVVLSSSANPEQNGLQNGAYVQLEALKGNLGNQNYELPADVDLSQYKSVVIWCRTFNVVFGYATLESAS